MESVLLFGLGKSHLSLGRLLLGEGVRVFYSSDSSKDKGKLKGAIWLDEQEIKESTFSRVFVTPGVPPAHWIHQRFLVENEIAYASKKLGAKIIGVTGTNGKSTQVALLTALLKHAGINAGLGGNFGTPISELVGQGLEFVVVELSSFQLHSLHQPFLDLAILTGLEPDHLDWHGNFKKYKEAKRKVVHLMREAGQLIRPVGTPSWTRSEVVIQDQTVESGAYGYAGTKILSPGVQLELKESLRPFQAPLSFALAAFEKMGIGFPDLNEFEFEPLPHRLQNFHSESGIDFVDDSKATTPDATIYALEQLPHKKLSLVLGGKSKGVDPRKFLGALLKYDDRLHRLYLYGDVYDSLGDCAFDECIVQSARKWDDMLALLEGDHPDFGDCLLLSPGYSSLDQFTSFGERGLAFQKFVRQLSP